MENGKVWRKSWSECSLHGFWQSAYGFIFFQAPANKLFPATY